MHLTSVVLSGGAGTRLWPLSRTQYPKQFHTLFGDRSLLQQSCSRAVAATDNHHVLVVSNEQHRFLVAEQLRTGGFDQARILLEPCARNTAPAAALAAFHLHIEHDDAVMVVMPSDHVMRNVQSFAAAVRIAAHWAQRDRLVTFGITPTAPNTGYGYIKRGRALSPESDEVYEIERFVEKPDAATAAAYVADGQYYWNSGIFVFKATTFLEELQAWRPAIHAACEAAIQRSTPDGIFLRVAAAAFAASPSDSIDYAVMENTRRAVVLPYSDPWSDIGSWSGVADQDAAGGDGNVMQGDVIATDTGNTFVRGDKRLVALVGVRDMIVVDTDDAVLVAKKGFDQEVKSVVAKLGQGQRREVETHTKVYRPWGSYQELDRGEGFQVKRLILKPGASISLQLHRKRSEHWVVVRGAAVVTRGTEQFALQANESTYIPRETLHKLENKGDIDLEVVEVQTGTYLGEDDIERFEDQYGRV